MAKRKGFDSISLSSEEIDERIKAHRRANTIKIGLILLAIVIVVVATQMWMSLRTYTDYEVKNTIQQGDKSASHFAELNGKVVEYTNDGVVCSDGNGALVWNCAFEMATPQIHVSKNYLTVYDRGGTKLYIMQDTGVIGEIETPAIIRTACVANHGTVAVLLENGMNYYVKLYDKTGKELANGEFYGEQGSVPVDIALSFDGKKLAVDLINITGGTVDTIISFYNFGDVGQSEINNNVGSYTYEDELISQIDYVSDNTMLAVGDKTLRTYTGAQKPEVDLEFEYEHELESFIYDSDGIGIVYANNDEAGTHHLALYNIRGKLIMEKDFSMSYENVEFLSNNEVCITNKYECEIYTLHGVKKFEHKFDKEIYKILYNGGNNEYILISNGATEEVRLK